LTSSGTAMNSRAMLLRIPIGCSLSRSLDLVSGAG
jgi:hypothetical protein